MPWRWRVLLLSLLALSYCYSRDLLLLYGDAVAHLGIARRILDSRIRAFAQLGGVWLPLPHLLMLPFVPSMEWWQSGAGGRVAFDGCYVLGVAGIYRLARQWLTPRGVAGGDCVFCVESEPAVSRDHGDDGAAVSGGADLDGAADGGVLTRAAMRTRAGGHASC